MPIKETTNDRHNQIRKDFEKHNVKEYGVYKYTKEWLFHYIAKKHFLKPKTIENIVFYRV